MLFFKIVIMAINFRTDTYKMQFAFHRFDDQVGTSIIPSCMKISVVI